MSDLKKFLQQFKDENGKSLDDHVQNTLTKLLLKNPTNWFNSFEDYSLRVKTQNFDLENLDVDDNHLRLREPYSELEKWGARQGEILIGVTTL